MGKKFPIITNLKAHPQFFEKTLKLIEKSFKYAAPFSFAEDFAPLVESGNHHNCFILVDEAENVLAHVGAKDRIVSVNDKEFTVTMLGGIAVEERARGEGHFTTLFNDVLAEKRGEAAFLLLWSDLEKLYNKFGFQLCGTQFEVPRSPQAPLEFEQTKYHLLSAAEKEELRALYETSFAKTYLTLERSAEDWEGISRLSSADLYLERFSGTIRGYFFKGKGQDLTDIIYEYGTAGDLPRFVTEASRVGKVWAGSEILETEETQYQFFLCPGDLRAFTEFIKEFSAGKILIRNINLLKQEVFFDFTDELYSLELADFLRGIFGPGTFEELELRPLYISGLDSI